MAVGGLVVLRLDVMASGLAWVHFRPWLPNHGDDAFSTITLPLEMLYTDQHQWVANALETNARYGNSTEAPADNKAAK